MPPKKAAKASADGEADDISCETLFKNYKKQCAVYAIDVNKQIKAAYDNEWVENAVPIKKVSPHLLLCQNNLDWPNLCSFICGTRSAGRASVRSWRPRAWPTINTAPRFVSGAPSARMRASV